MATDKKTAKIIKKLILLSNHVDIAVFDPLPDFDLWMNCSF